MNPIMRTIVAVLKAVAMAMGVAVLVLSIMDVVTVKTAVLLLSIGLFAVGLVLLQGDKSEEQG